MCVKPNPFCAPEENSNPDDQHGGHGQRGGRGQSGTAPPPADRDRFELTAVRWQGRLTASAVGQIVGLQSEEIKQMASEYAERVSAAPRTPAAQPQAARHMTCLRLRAAVGAVVGGAVGALRTAAAAAPSRGLSGETDPATPGAAGGGQPLLSRRRGNGRARPATSETLSRFRSFRPGTQR